MYASRTLFQLVYQVQVRQGSLVSQEHVGTSISNLARMNFADRQLASAQKLCVVDLFVPEYLCLVIIV